MIFFEYESRAALAAALAARLAADLAAALAAKERVLLAVPGGTSPAPVFTALAQAPLDWARVDLILSDERWVPESSPRSNAALLRAHLCQGPAAAARFLPYVEDAGKAPEAALPRLTAQIVPLLPVDVLLLGMGADRHIASLFPGAEGLAAALAPDAAPLAVLRAEAAGEPRLSLTAPVLQNAAQVHLLIFGDDKRAALEKASGQGAETAPVTLVLPKAQVHWAA